MMSVRAAAVAGFFYPEDPSKLTRDLQSMLQHDVATHHAKIIVAPHAGYVYSGPVAAAAFAPLKQRPEITRVVLIGPAHRVYFEGIAMPAAEAFATPLGTVPIDTTPIPHVIVNDRAHAQEHSLEVELPFLQATLPSPFTLVPLLCGDVEPEVVARVIQHLWGGPETLIVISSDLSHYLPYATAQRTDADTAHRVTHLDAGITHEQACGATPLNAALLVAKQRGMRVQQLDLRNSGDTAGDKDRVVGYASFAIA